MRVCVIGAGAAGLGCAYHLAKSRIDHVVYEQSSCVGGTWVYSDEVNVHSSMYRDLRTNLPIEIMGYPGFPFPPNDKSFAHHSVVLAYLQNFFNEHVLPCGNVSFNSKVVSVRHEDPNWTVDFVVNGEEKKTEVFSHLMVCSGKYTTPRIPLIEGTDTFSGVIEHSHNYRAADKYAGKRVLVVGAGFSGLDIALEISRVTDSCFLSHRSGEPLALLPTSIVQKKNIVRLSGNKVFFDEDSIEVDYIIYCTGYMISFPFLDNVVTVNDGYEVCDVYRHCLSITKPSLAFIGLPSFIVPCTVFDFQIRWVIAVFLGQLALPSAEEMRKHSDENRRKRIQSGMGCLKFAHNLRGVKMWDYLDSFAADGLGPVNPIVRQGYEASHEARLKSLTAYRDQLLKF